MTTRNTLGHRRTRGTEGIITAKLLMLQSRRLMLSCTLRRLERYPDDDRIQARVDSMSVKVALAQLNYRESILRWGSPEHADYWLVAYNRLIDMGNTLTGKLRAAAHVLPFPERYEVSADVEALEEIVDHWTESMRLAMVAEAG